MAKKIRYPRKLRQTIEKIAEARDEREQREAGTDVVSNLEYFYRPYWYEFFPSKSMKRIDQELDDVRRLISGTYRFELEYQHPVLCTDPPFALWEPETDEGEASE